MAHSVKNKKSQNSILQVAVLDLNSYVQQNILISWDEKANSMQNNHLLKILVVTLVIWIRHKMSLTTLIVKKSLLYHSCILSYTLLYILYPVIYPITQNILKIYPKIVDKKIEFISGLATGYLETCKGIYCHQLQPHPLCIFEGTNYGFYNRIELSR